MCSTARTRGASQSFTCKKEEGVGRLLFDANLRLSIRKKILTFLAFTFIAAYLWFSLLLFFVFLFAGIAFSLLFHKTKKVVLRNECDE